jgi:hypothetical protein
MSGAYSLLPALPSPPEGVPIPATRIGLWFRRAVLTHITPEPSDLPGRIAIGSVLVPKLLGLFLPPFGTPFWDVHNQFFHFYVRLWGPLALLTIVGGLTTRSRSARALGIVNIASLALMSAAHRYGVPLSLFTGLAGTVLPAATTVALGIWLIRGLRRRLDRGESNAPELLP